jgi:hypothetical protein
MTVTSQNLYSQDQIDKGIAFYSVRPRRFPLFFEA